MLVNERRLAGGLLAILALTAAAGCGEASRPGATPGAVAALEVEAGAGQTGIPGLVLPDSVVVVATDDDGRAAAEWTLGVDPGEDALLATAGDAQAEASATAEHARPGEGYEGRRGYIEYVAGDLPIVITAPHGGTLEPAVIPDRSYGTTVRDMNTTELAHAIADSLAARTGRRPHVVTVLLRRTKLDANRDIEEAAQGHPRAERAWHDFHGFVELLRGATSLGTLYEDAGFSAVPTVDRPDPGDAPFFSGGYNTRRYGSRDGGPISGVQIEANLTGVRDGPESWARFAAATTDALIEYFRTHYGVDLTAAAPTPVPAGIR